MKYMNYNIEYGENHNGTLIIQANFNAIHKISFFNWDEKDITSLLTAIVAVWRVKSMKPKQDHKPYIMDTSFCLN